MTGSRRHQVRLVLLALLIFGVGAAIGASFTGATFSDSQDGSGSFTAASDFGSSGPLADAGGPYSVDEGQSTALDGTNSAANGGTIKTYSWTIVGGGPGSLTDATTAQPTYNAPSNVNADTDVTVELTVTDNKGNTDTDSATVTVNDTGAADVPSVDSLTVTKTGNKNRKFTVDTDVSDPTGDGDVLDTVTIEAVRTQNGNVQYSNTITVSGDTATVTDTTGKLGNNKEYEIRVTVTDTTGDSAVDSTTKTTG